MNTIEMNHKEVLFFEAYIEALYETQGELADDGDNALDAEFLRESRIDCLYAYGRMACYLSDDQIESAGRDLWFTRNRDGIQYHAKQYSDFWSRPAVYGELHTAKFGKIADAMGEVSPVFEGLGPDLPTPAIPYEYWPEK